MCAILSLVRDPSLITENDASLVKNGSVLAVVEYRPEVVVDLSVGDRVLHERLVKASVHEPAVGGDVQRRPSDGHLPGQAAAVVQEACKVRLLEQRSSGTVRVGRTQTVRYVL